MIRRIRPGLVQGPGPLQAGVLAAAWLAGGCGAAPVDDGAGWYPGETVVEARLFAPGIVSTAAGDESGIAFVPDGRTAYFSRRSPGERPRIWEIRWEEGGWRRPVVAPFSSEWDGTPWVTPGGDRVYFASERDGALLEERRTSNIWYAERSAGAWEPPKPLPGEVNRARPENAGRGSAGDESSPVVGPDGALYYWSQESGRDASQDIYRARPSGAGFGPGEPLPEPLNSDGVESNLTFTPDGLLVFQGFGRNDGFGGDDLFYSQELDGRWTEPAALPSTVNTPANEGFPAVTPDGRYLLFASDRGGSWSIYFVELATLGLEVR